jgi:hypothetical protein
MTDAEKLEVLFEVLGEVFGIEVDYFSASIVARGRRFYFDREGQVSLVIDYKARKDGNVETILRAAMEHDLISEPPLTREQLDSGYILPGALRETI